MTLRGTGREPGRLAEHEEDEQGLEEDDLELEPPNMLLAHLFDGDGDLVDAEDEADGSLVDWIGGLLGELLGLDDEETAVDLSAAPTGSGPAVATGPATTQVTPPAGTGAPDAISGASPIVPTGDGAGGAGGRGAASGKDAPRQAAKDGGSAADRGTDGDAGAGTARAKGAGGAAGPAGPGPSAGGPVPVAGSQITDRVDGALGQVAHPKAPNPATAGDELDRAGAAADARGTRRLRALATAPGQLAGPAPAHRPPPVPDRGPIPEQMDAVKKATGHKLDPESLPPLTPSPRGTVPDVAGPVLSDDEIRIVRLGEVAIAAMVTDTDPQGKETQDRLRAVRASLGQVTAAAPVVAPGLIGPPAPIPGVAIVDEQVAGVELTAAQRQLFAGVVGQLRGESTAEAATILTAIRTSDAKFPRGTLQSAFSPPLGADLERGLSEELVVQANDLAGALQMAPDQIDAAITTRREEVVRLKAQAEAARKAALGEAQTVAVDTDAKTRGAATAGAAAVKTTVAKDRAVAKPVSQTQARVERALAELTGPVATELARLDTQQRQRERAIADAVRSQVSAIALAQTRDELALQPAKSQVQSTENLLKQGEVGRWARAEIAALREGPGSAQNRLVAQAQRQTDLLKDGLKTASTTAITSLRAWGAAHTKSTDTWWTELDGNLGRWADQAIAQAELWKTQQGEASRLALAQDLESFQRIVALQQAGDKDAVDAYLTRLDAEGKTVVLSLIRSLNSGAVDIAGALTAGIRERVRAANQERIQTDLEGRVDAMYPAYEDAEYEGLLRIAEVLQPGWNLVERAEKIHTAVTRYRGHDEKSIFQALGGLSPIAAKLLPIYYGHRWQPLGDALRGEGHVGHLDQDEMDTATQLLKGDRVQGAIGAINSAITGPGADNDEVNRILRELTPAERKELEALYEKRYGASLDRDLRDQWSLSKSEVDESMAITHNDPVGASAIALGRSVYTLESGGPGGDKFERGPREKTAHISRDKAAGVYAQIRSEVEAQGARNNWVTEQVEAEITLRNRELERRFDLDSAEQWWAKDKGTGATRTAFALASPAGRDLLNGLADNDMLKVDIARIQLEDAGVYAEDAALNMVFRDQNTRSLADVQRDLGPVLSARTEAQLRSEEANFTTEEKRVNRRMELERANAKVISAGADDLTRQRMGHLGTGYEGKSGRSLDAMIDANMSGWSATEARVRVAQGGVLTDYQKVRYSIKGLGTDLPTLRATVAGMSEQELFDADTKWRRDNGGESLQDAIEGDTSGRDQRDLVDMATHGAPQTAAEVAAAARRKVDSDAANQGAAGRWLTSGEVSSAEHEVARLEAQLAELRRSDLGADARARASMGFDIAIQHANSAIEAQRAALDSVTDMLANAAAIVTAVVVGAALSPFTGGGSALVAAAVIGSLCATAVSISVKALIKGGDYGHEEFYTDLAVGAVDALVAALTAGLGNALLGKAARGVTPVGKSALFRALSQLGTVGRAAAKGQARVAGFLGRLGTQGLLVRGLERQALLGGLHESEHLALRLIAKGSAQLIEQGAQAVPSSLTAALMDERVYRQPGGPMLVLTSTLEGTAHSTAMGLGLAGAHHLGAMGAGLGLHGIRTVADGLRVAMPGELRMPTGDVLAHLGTPTDRLREFRAWREANPTGTAREFVSELKSRAIDAWQLRDPNPEHTRAAREQLLADLPAAERGRYADVPIRSVPEAEFARLTGGAGGDAHLLIKDGQAVIVLREGGAPSAARALLPEVQARVFTGTRGLTLEGALPRHLRDTPIRIDTKLPSDEVRVVPIPRDGGPITGVEVVMGGSARPIDLALHAGEITRIRRWTGRLGEARLALADFGNGLGLDLTSPRDRARFEAAGEVGKLAPIIEERIRRLAAAKDPLTAAAIEGQALHLMAQQERARRILTGELVVEPRGYVAAEGLPEAPVKPAAPDEPEVAAKPVAEPIFDPFLDAAPFSADMEPKARAADAIKAVNMLPAIVEQRRRALVAAVAKEGEITRAVNASENTALIRAEVLGKRGPLSWIQEFDVSDTESRGELIAELERRLGSAADVSPEARQRELAAEVRDNYDADRRSKRPIRPDTAALKLVDLLHALRKLEVESTAAPDRIKAAVEAVPGAYAALVLAESRVQYWVQQLVTGGHGGVPGPNSGTRRSRAGVELSPRLFVDPTAPEGYVPHLLEGETLAEQFKHLFGYHAELSMANRIADHLNQQVLEYGDRIGTNGADATSVATTGEVNLWDSKNRMGGERNVNSETFTEEARRLKAVEMAKRAVQKPVSATYTEAMRAAAIKNLEGGNFTTYTVTSQDATTFHSAVEMRFVNHKLVSTKIVPVPWGAGR